MEAHFFLFAEVFIEDLEEELGYQCFDMLLIRVLSVNPLDVHLANVAFIFVAQLVHAANQLVPLIGQIGELVI